MKRILIYTAAGLLILFISAYIGLYIWIDQSVKENIGIAQKLYLGKAEDALIAYLSDTSHTPSERTCIAIWTLGQIQSEKAVPILKSLYKNDPKGETCYRKHDRKLCQYEIYKALNAQEINWWPLHQRLNK